MMRDDIAINTKLKLLAPLAKQVNAVADEAMEMLAHVERELASMQVGVEVQIEPEAGFHMAYAKAENGWHIIACQDGIDSGYGSLSGTSRQRRIRMARHLPALLDAIGQALQRAAKIAGA